MLRSQGTMAWAMVAYMYSPRIAARCFSRVRVSWVTRIFRTWSALRCVRLMATSFSPPLGADRAGVNPALSHIAYFAHFPWSTLVTAFLSLAVKLRCGIERRLMDFCSLPRKAAHLRFSGLLAENRPAAAESDLRPLAGRLEAFAGTLEKILRNFRKFCLTNAKIAAKFSRVGRKFRRKFLRHMELRARADVRV